MVYRFKAKRDIIDVVATHLTLEYDISNGKYYVNNYEVTKDTYDRLMQEIDPSDTRQPDVKITEPCIGYTVKGDRGLIVLNYDASNNVYPWKFISFNGDTHYLTNNGKGYSCIDRLDPLPELNITKPCVGYTKTGEKGCIFHYNGTDSNQYPWEWIGKKHRFTITSRGQYTVHSPNNTIIYVRDMTPEDVFN